ncbi:GNAT family N-acetyltransferase [Blastochloris sulfoviridis]|uniref:GNAT family N-acetyltransferase n=1 Tax=Blastochloris sulfoviridis TaxID=50712 RepID=UPI001FEC62CA|nr:GNAT family N-acetyltransferase [Blastochloris sulfoviridis]
MPAETFRWRPLQPADLDAVMAVAGVVHPTFPERRETFADKLALAPDCNFALEGGDGALAGYAVALPWRTGEVVALDAVYGALPEPCDVLYIHDIALLPAARGRALAGDAVALLVAAARRRGLAQLSLTAVYGADAVWARHGFGEISNPGLRAKLASYGEAARYMVRTTEA